MTFAHTMTAADTTARVPVGADEPLGLIATRFAAPAQLHRIVRAQATAVHQMLAGAAAFAAAGLADPVTTS